MKSWISILVFLFGGLALFAPTTQAVSRFLDEYPTLQKDADRPGALIYRKEGVSLKPYTKVYLDPILVWYHADAEYKGIDPNELQVVTEAMRAIIVDTLEPDYPVVSKPGPGVLRVRLAITDVQAQKRKKSLLRFTPVGMVVTGAKMAMGADSNVDLTEATIEAELLDGQSGEQLAVLVDRLNDGVGENKASKISWDAIQASLEFYAKRFRSRIDAEHRQ